MQMQYNFACVLNNTKKKIQFKSNLLFVIFASFLFHIIVYFILPPASQIHSVNKIPRQNKPLNLRVCSPFSIQLFKLLFGV